MTNNDKLRQVISNVQILNELANSMCDAEIYPVSFFSQAFDLIQKIQNDVHMLEADQVEMFSEQLKKHRALLVSIHQQMRNFSIPAHPLSETEPASSVNLQKPVPAPPAVEPTAITAGQMEAPATQPEQLTRPMPPPDAPVIQQAPVVQQARPARPMPPPDAPVVQPEWPMRNAPGIQQPERPTREVPVIQQERPTRLPMTPDAPVTRPARPVPTEELPTVNDAMEKKKMADLRKAFSLNDHFRYRKELFGGSEEAMNKVITILNNKKSLGESIAFLEQKLHWDFNDPTVKDFIKMLEMRFL